MMLVWSLLPSGILGLKMFQGPPSKPPDPPEKNPLKGGFIWGGLWGGLERDSTGGVRCKRCGSQNVMTSTGTFGPHREKIKCMDCEAVTWGFEPAGPGTSSRQRAKRYGGRVGQYKRRDVFEADGWTCQICRATVSELVPVHDMTRAHIDHIIPLSRGGDDTRENVQTLCQGCNLKKGSTCDNP